MSCIFLNDVRRLICTDHVISLFWLEKCHDDVAFVLLIHQDCPASCCAIDTGATWQACAGSTVSSLKTTWVSQGDSDDCRTSPEYSGCAMFHVNCKNVTFISSSNEFSDDSAPHYQSYPCLSAEGQSGAPVWLFDPVSGYRSVLGINIGGGKGSGAAPGTFLVVSTGVYLSVTGFMEGFVS